MKKQWRGYPLYSLCGLNCGLCPMYHVSETDHCPGCGGEGHSPCAIVKCSREHGGIEFCYQCADYPCERYQNENPYDSFVPYRNVRKDFEKAKAWGIDSYKEMLDQKVELLRFLLKHYNDGRHKSFFCTAVNFLELQDVQEVIARIRDEVSPDADLKERCKQAAQLFQKMADARGISLKLHKPPKKSTR